MAESAVIFLLSKLTLLLKEEENLLRGFRGEVTWINEELQRMSAFLGGADTIEGYNVNHGNGGDGDDEQLYVRVSQVRDVAYDTQDVLDHLALRLYNNNYNSEGNRFISILSKYSIRVVKNLKVRHEIGSRIRMIKYRIETISEGFRRYRDRFELLGNEGTSTRKNISSYDYDRRCDGLFVEEDDLVGIQEPKRQLVEWLAGDSRLNVVSVVGMGGLGKTTLIKKVYDDGQVKKHFDSHAWINISQAYDLDELLKDVIFQLYNERKHQIPERADTGNRAQLTEVINEFLKDKRYLIVLDDVWKVNDWEGFKYALPRNNLGSRVLLTTRVSEVAYRSSNESHGHVYVLKPLSSEESWALFCKKTFRTTTCPTHLIKISESILKRCEGLPLAIAAISGILCTKDTADIDEWEMIHRSIGAELESNDGLKSMRKILSLGFNALPYYLKSCFLYLSIFPEDYLIERMRLIRLWMAEGFIEDKQGKTREEVANSYLNELLNRNMMQVAELSLDGRVRTCRVHDLIREILLSKSKYHIFVAMDSNSTRFPEKVRSICFHNCSQQLSKSPVSQLRSLLMFGGTNTFLSSSVIPMIAHKCAKLLTVLDLMGAPLDVFPDEICQLLNLRYLSLRDTNLKKIPISIGKLRNLETLDLKGTYITELPKAILKLKKLRHLKVYRYEQYIGHGFPSIYGFKGPSAMGALSSLQKLNYFEANQDSSSSSSTGGTNLMQEIASLSQLRRLGITKLRKEDAQALCHCIGKLSHLRSLSLQALEEHEIIDLRFLTTPPQFLQLLELGGRLEKLPNWVPYAHSLKKIFLRWSRIQANLLESIGDLPNLIYLELVTAYNGETLCFQNGRFQKLKLLRLINLENLRAVIVEENAMPDLEELLISGCRSLDKVPSGIEKLTKLWYLRLFDVPEEFKKAISEDYLKVAHIQNIVVY